MAVPGPVGGPDRPHGRIRPFGVGRCQSHGNRPRTAASATHASDAVVFPSQVGIAHPDWARLASRPEVARLAVWDLLFGNYDGQPGAVIFGSKDGTYLGKVDKPVVVQGRMFNPHASDEVVIDENSLKEVTSADGSEVSETPHVGGPSPTSSTPRNNPMKTRTPSGPEGDHAHRGGRAGATRVRVRIGRTGAGVARILGSLRKPDTDGRERRRQPPSRGRRYGGTSSRCQQIPRPGHTGPRFTCDEPTGDDHTHRRDHGIVVARRGRPPGWRHSGGPGPGPISFDHFR